MEPTTLHTELFQGLSTSLQDEDPYGVKQAGKVCGPSHQHTEAAVLQTQDGPLHMPIPVNVEQVPGLIGTAAVFSKLDVTTRVELCFSRLPFGQDHFCSRVPPKTRLVENSRRCPEEFRCNSQEHDISLNQVLQHLEKAGTTVNQAEVTPSLGLLKFASLQSLSQQRAQGRIQPKLKQSRS